MALAHLTMEQGHLIAVVDEHCFTPVLKREVTLFMALIRKEKFELVLQKATELGVTRIVPLLLERNIVKWEQDSNKLQRYRLILKEAAEQCHRLTIPELCEPIPLKLISQYLCEQNFVAYEVQDPSQELKNQLKEVASISIVIGPEGGITPKEIDFLKQTGFNVVSLGPRIYRAETASMVAIHTVDCVLGL
jgi:16S rRNA (uracil1498-N3)-methyltransferase